jgi:hypothetical protein
MIRFSGVSGDTRSRRRSETTPTRWRRSSVEIKNHLDVARVLQLGDRLADRHVFVEGEDMRVHDAAGGLLVVFEQVFDHARFLRAHQIEHGRRQLFRQVVDQRGGVVGRNFLRELGDLLGGARAEECGARFGAELGDRFHGQTPVALGEQAEGRLAVLVGKLAEDLGEVGGVLLLKQVQQVGSRTNAQQSFDRVKDEIDSALRRHRKCPPFPKRLNVTRECSFSIPDH